MHWLFFLMHYYPILAICICLILGQVAFFYRRKKDKLEYVCWALVFVFAASTGAWVFFRGDVRSDQWVRKYIE